jgi:ferrous iron transport protein B
VATVLGLVAKEEIVGVFGSISAMEGVSDASFFAGGLQAYSFMIFNLLCAPCFAAMGAIKHEMNDWRWTAFAISYMCAFAYAISLMVYQFGSLFMGDGFGIGTAFAFAVLLGMIYLLVRKNKYQKLSV